MKIKYSLLDKWCACNLTNKEYDFLIHIAHYQDDYGRIQGMYYRDVCSACGMSIQTFYDVLHSLETKKVITYIRVNNDYDITILDNDFAYEGAYQEGYINVSRTVFDDIKFKKLRAKEKLLLMLFMRVTHENGKSYQIGTEKFYKKYMALLGVTKNILRTYLHAMKKFFSIGRKDGKYFITYLASVFNPRRSQSETDQFLGHIVKTGCRRNKIKAITAAAITDTIQLVKQYRKEARDQGQNMLELIMDCISNSVRSFEYKTLDAKYVHKLIRQRLSLPSGSCN